MQNGLTICHNNVNLLVQKEMTEILMSIDKKLNFTNPIAFEREL